MGPVWWLGLPDVRCATLSLVIDPVQLVCAQAIRHKQHQSTGGWGVACGGGRGHAVDEGRGEVDIKDGAEEDEVHTETNQHQVPVGRLNNAQTHQLIESASFFAL